MLGYLLFLGVKVVTKRALDNLCRSNVQFLDLAVDYTDWSHWVNI